MRKIIGLFQFFTVVAFLTSVGLCQTNDEGLAFLQLNFFNPGARALGMGGAFVALADDATAALANPAGLTTLTKPEMSLEFSATRYRNQIPWITGYRTWDSVVSADGGFIDFNFFFHFEPQDFPSTPKSLSFASFVYPVVKNKFVLSGFYNEQTRFERNFDTKGFDTCRDRDGNFCGRDFSPTHNSLDLSIKNIGFSSGFKPIQTVSFGLTVNFSHLSLDSRSVRECIICEPGIIDQILSENGNDNRVSYTLGTLIKATQDFSVGAVYSKRPVFRILATTTNFLEEGYPLERPEILRIPDSFALGFSLRATDRLSVNMDLVRILYSQLMDGYFNAYGGPPFNRDFGKTSFEITDGTEYRLGAEYVVFLWKVPFAIRGGYWREPFHGMTWSYEDADLRVGVDANGQYIGNIVPFVFPFFSRSFRQDYHHVTFGAGVVLKTFTIDWAYDYAENFKRFIVSSVFYLDWLARK